MSELLKRAWGVPAIHELATYLEAAIPTDWVLDVIEAWFPAMRELLESVYRDAGHSTGMDDKRFYGTIASEYRSRVNDVLDEHDMAWQLVGEEMVPRGSMAMHATIVAPVVALTTGDARYAAVERACQKALGELKPGQDPSDRALMGMASSTPRMAQCTARRGGLERLRWEALRASLEKDGRWLAVAMLADEPDIGTGDDPQLGGERLAQRSQ